jgi:hypothetical protein
MNDWKKVTEVKPPETGTIIFYTNDLRNPTDTVIGVFRGGKYYSGGTEFCNITHWMEVPEPPK